MTISASEFNVPFEALADRTAVLVPDVRVYEVGNTDQWHKPAYALRCDFVLVGGGGGGGAGSASANSAGGGGGSRGAIRRYSFAADDVPDTLEYITVGDHGDGGASDGTNGGITQVYPDTGDFLLAANGGEGGAKATATGGAGGSAPHDNALPDVDVDGYEANGFGGGGGTSGSGNNGSPGYGRDAAANGGAAGASYGAGGSPGVGYGAGGGGGGGYSPGAGDGGGGGGGANGYGVQALAQAGSSGPTYDAPGGNGAPGVVVITSWCGVNSRT